jgi:6-phosphofructokinase 2
MQKIISLSVKPTIDVEAEIDKVEPEKKLRCKHPSIDPGGGGINVSRAVHKLGGTCTAYFSSGGGRGTLLETLLKKEEITFQTINRKEEISEGITILETSSNTQYRFTIPGGDFTEEEWKEILNIIQNLEEVPDYFVASGGLLDGIPADFYRRAGEIVKAKGSRFILDTSGDALKEGAGSHCFLIKPNMREFRSLITGSVETAEAGKRGVQYCRESGVENLLISLGKEGAVWCSSRGHWVRYTSPEVEIQSKVGAGDSMTAGVTLGLAKGMEMEEAVKYGIAAGTAAVMTPGTELCRKEDTERIFREIRILQKEKVS